MNAGSGVQPKISICIPNLNTRPFLAERFATIFNQSFQHWELLVYDSHSDDGSWEYIQDLATKEDRMRIWQGPRKGAYPAWNECIRQAKGEYVYIATSDDTMAEDCLQKLATALEEHPECDLAHCPLVVVDEAGKIVADRPAWPAGTVFGHGLTQNLRRPHIRRAPYDGLLHLTQMHTYLSITQLLIRRSLFARTGDFQSRWGSVSDFNWEMKAGLLANVIHVPNTWATWRLHSNQLSASINIFSPEHEEKFNEMIEDAIETCWASLDPAIVAGLKAHWIGSSEAMRRYYGGLLRRPNKYDRKLFQLHQLLCGEPCVRSEILDRLFNRPKWGDRFPAEIRLWLKSFGSDPISEIG